MHAPSITPSAKRRWGAEQRLEFIEFRAFWEGGVNRADLRERFGVSAPQASSDLSAYMALAPGNLIYDLSAKRYVAAPGFAPAIITPSAERYLAQLSAIEGGVLAVGDTWIGTTPAVETTPLPARAVDPAIVRELLAVMRTPGSIEIRYQSMNPAKPDLEWRRITPHALASDGLRWHLRAWCHQDEGFKDFVLARCRGLRQPGPPGRLAMADLDWNTSLDVRLIPNPALSPAQRAAVAWDFAMSGEHLDLPVRRALLYYLRKRLRLDVEDAPAETPVVVANQAEFDAALAAARGQAMQGGTA
jgi:hypothetical protein